MTNKGTLEHNATLPSVRDRALAPSLISANRAPNLSPVGSLTNLLTDLSSTGFRRRGSNNQVAQVDKNKEIPMILAKEVAAKKHRQLSIPPVLLQANP